MANYSFPGAVVLVQASPVKGFSDVPDAVSLEVTGRDSGELTLRLLKSSKLNAALTSFVALGKITPIMLPVMIKPGGINDFIWIANSVFGGRIEEGTGGTVVWYKSNVGGMPTTYLMGNEVGTVEWKLKCVGINMALLGG